MPFVGLLCREIKESRVRSEMLVCKVRCCRREGRLWVYILGEGIGI